MAQPIQIAALEKPKFSFSDQFRLSWKHFKKVGYQPTAASGEAVHAVVGSLLDVVIERHGKMPLVKVGTSWRLGYYEVRAVLDTANTLVWKKLIESASETQRTELLKHERVHVEILERHGRHFYSAMGNLRSTQPDLVGAAKDLAAKTVNLRSQYKRKLEDFNAAYDHQTNHGRIKPTQARWNALYLKKETTNESTLVMPA